MQVQKISPPKSVGDLLVEARLITREQWLQAMEAHLQNNYRAEQYLVEQNMLAAETLAFFTSQFLGISYMSLNNQEIDPDALELVPEQLARRHGTVPVFQRDGTLVVAMEAPRDLEAVEDIAAVTQRRIEPVLATSQEIQELLDRHYRVSGEIEKQLSQIPTQENRASGGQERRVSAAAIAQAPVVRALDLLLSQAVRDRASDIHIEPQEDRLRVRFRIDGNLHEVMNLPPNVHAPLVSRIKIMSGMNIAERRRPQDGQITHRVQDKEVDIRAASAPTIYGEQVVLRILVRGFQLRLNHQ